MNIFTLYDCPVLSAIHQCDKHIVKMPTETSQMMVSALLRHGADPATMPLTKKGTPSKGGYPNHPSTRWVGNTDMNFTWVGIHGISLCEEYTRRYGKRHFCQDGIEHMLARAKEIPTGNIEQFPIAINKDSNCCKVAGFDTFDRITQYRLYYAFDKVKIAKWDKRPEMRPDWYDLPVEEIMKGR